jgi:Flp pilus assembly protein TadD
MSRKFVVILVAAVALATYWNGLHAPFMWDDDVAITTNQSIHQISESLNPPIETPVSGRPVVNLSLAINYAMGGLNPVGYHVFNLAVHVLCALLLFGIVRRTLTRQQFFSDKTRIDPIALACALIWMVHPLLSETIDYTTQRTESLMGFFFLLTLYAAIRARDRKKRRATLSGSPAWTFVAIGSCALGMATKESMAVAPVVVVLYDLIFEFNSTNEAFASRRTLYIGLAATWVELGLIMWRWPRSTVGAATVSPIAYLMNQAQMIARYLWLTVWPRSLVVDYGLPQQVRIGDVIPQGMLILPLLAATIVALVRWPAVGFLGAMFFITLAPTSSVVPILSEVGAERRMYLPLAAIVVLVVTLVARAIERPAKAGRDVQILVVAAVVAALAIRTIERNRDYDSPLALWQADVDRRPHGRSRFALANQLMDAGRHDDAIAQLRLAAVDFPDARAGLGTELLVQGHLQEGISVLEAFVASAPSLPNRAPARVLMAQAHRALAERALSQQNAALAAEEARQSVALDGTNADAHNVLGAALASQGKIAEAIPEFQAAVKINPQLQSAVNNLARAMVYSGAANTSK